MFIVLARKYIKCKLFLILGMELTMFFFIVKGSVCHKEAVVDLLVMYVNCRLF